MNTKVLVFLAIGGLLHSSLGVSEDFFGLTLPSMPQPENLATPSPKIEDSCPNVSGTWKGNCKAISEEGKSTTEYEYQIRILQPDNGARCVALEFQYGPKFEQTSPLHIGTNGFKQESAAYGASGSQSLFHWNLENNGISGVSTQNDFKNFSYLQTRLSMIATSYWDFTLKAENQAEISAVGVIVLSDKTTANSSVIPRKYENRVNCKLSRTLGK